MAKKEGLRVTVVECNWPRRKYLWEKIGAQIGLTPKNKHYKNLEIRLRSEPQPNDPKAIRCYVTGDGYGTLGFIDKKDTEKIRGLFPDGKRLISKLQCEIAESYQIGEDEIDILVSMIDVD